MEKVLYSEWLKVLAIVAMVVDHVGLALFPEQEWLRAVGRIAFPLFAYQIVIGFQYTRSKRKMLERLLLFYAVSHYPYMWLTGSTTLNIFATLSLAFVAMWALDARKFYVLPLVLGFVVLVPVDYGLYGIALILSFYFLRKTRKPVAIASIALFLFGITGLYSVHLGTDLQMYALFGMVLGPVLIRIPDAFRLHKYFYYAFYPGHMAAIALLALLI